MDRKTKRKIINIVATSCEGHEKFGELQVLGFSRIFLFVIFFILIISTIISFIWPSWPFEWVVYILPALFIFLLAHILKIESEKILLKIWQEWQKQRQPLETLEGAITNNIPDMGLCL